MSEPTRVAVTLTQCWHRVPGGTATASLGVVRALQQAEELELIGVGPAGDVRRPRSWRRTTLPAAPFTPPIPVARLPLPLPVLYDSWARWGAPSIESTTGPVDVVHLTVPLRAPLGRAPLVATVNDLFPLQDGMHPDGRGARLMGVGLRWIRDHAARVVVPSRATADDCLGAGFDEAQLRVVPYGVEPVDVDDTRAAEVASSHGLRGPFVLFVGTLEPRKNLSTLLEAMRRLERPDVTLALAGPAGWGGAADLPEVPFPVARLGFVPESDLAALMRASAVFCFPSLAEGFGLPVLEAMAAGAAVVTSSTTSTAEVAGDAALLVDPTDADAIGSAIAALLDDEALAHRLRSLGRERAARWTWAECARLTTDVYREVLA
ncbi:MAG: glycosyltransferase family 4 protein [Actinomycetota bacterium]|nr:glycosyltransferase family 4 protein [Actinomycetota bacterium]